MDDRVARTVATYEDVAEEYQDRHGDRSEVAPIVEAFRDRVETATVGVDDGPPRVVDVGCGPGWELATLADAGFDVLGVDISPAFLTAARERAPAVALGRGDMRRLPLATGAVDGVFALASLLHVPEAQVDDALAEFARVLTHGGVCTVVVKSEAYERDGAPYGDADDRHFEFYEEDAFHDRIERAGFDIGVSTSEDGWLAVHADHWDD